MAIQALVFDAYGTLFDVSSVIERCNRHFPGKGNQISEIWRIKQLEYTWLTSLMGQFRGFWDLTDAGLRFACHSLSLELKENIRHDLMNNYLFLTPYPEVRTTLENLSGKIQLAILSNGTQPMLDAVVGNAGISHLMDQVLSVDEVKIFKPSPKVYQLAADRLNLSKDQIGFVSSNAWDAAGAKAFGFQVFWINRFQRPMEELDLEPDYNISTLDQVIPKIQ